MIIDHRALTSHRRRYLFQFVLSLLYSVTTALISCKQTKESPLARALLSFAEQDTAGLVARYQGSERCEKIFSLDVESRDRVEVCSQHVADTVSYSYTAATNEHLIRGKSVHVSALDLKPYADSVQLAISRRLGTGVNCVASHKSDPFTYKLHYWRRDGNTIFLRATVLESPPLFPAVSIEVAHGEKPCWKYLGIPGRR